MPNASMHFVPKKLSECVIDSNLFKVQEKIISNPEKDIDANLIFDCRGRHNRDKRGEMVRAAGAHPARAVGAPKKIAARRRRAKITKTSNIFSKITKLY